MTSRARAALSGLAVAALFALPLLPEIAGTRRLVFRDAQITHWPWRRVAMESLARGEVPFVNDRASGGQPLLANPNAVLLYPTVLLERLLPPVPAFNLHYLLCVLWAFFGARVLARRLGLSDGPAFLSGVAFAFSGMTLSYGAAFMNSAAAASWLPWCVAAALGIARAGSVRETARASAATGLAFGLQLLAGEPAISLLTLAAAVVATLGTALAAPRVERLRRLGILGAGGAAAGALAVSLAAPLLLPLRQIFSLTYRGQHLYSEKAFGAAAFHLSRAIEWLLPRFGGDPGEPGSGPAWLRPLEDQGPIYVWCVTFGVVPLLAILLGALRKSFWDGRVAALAGGSVLALLFSFGLTLPLYRLLFEVPFLRRLRYPIKFYLLTTLGVALLAGLAAESLGRRRPGRREVAALALGLALFAAVWFVAGPRVPAPPAGAAAGDPYAAASLERIRANMRGDAFLGAAAAAAVGLLLWRSRSGGAGAGLGLLALLLAFPWGLPLFVTAPQKSLERPPALGGELAGTGRLYVSSSLPQFDLATLEPRRELPRAAAVSRVLLEELTPATGAPFGVRYLFETDPDGSYGWYNRIASEALAAWPPPDRDRLLRVYGARWVLAPEGEEHPQFRPVTGFSVAGKRLVLLEEPVPVSELRWIGRAFRRSSLSGTLDLLRSTDFDPARDVALPGREDHDPTSGEGASARILSSRVAPDAADIEVEAAGEGHVVFSRTFFPAWKATRDGEPVAALVANARDLAVPVPPGRHHIAIAWDRGPFRRGVLLQALAVAVALAAAARARSA